MKVVIKKITRRLNPELNFPVLVPTGAVGFGDFGIMKEKTAVEGVEEGINPNDPENYDYPDTLFARVGQCVMIGTPGSDHWIRTSRIRSYYVHETDGSHPDKLVLPKGFPVEDCAQLSLEELEPGDMLLATQNSIYLVRKQ